MNRRELLLGGVALAGAAMVGNAQAAEHDHMMMHDHQPAHPPMRRSRRRLQTVCKRGRCA